MQEKKHLVGYYLLYPLSILFVISGIYILVVGSVCIVTTNNYIENCQLFKYGKEINYYAVVTNTSLNLVFGIVCVILMGKDGLHSFRHSNLQIKQRYRVSLCKSKNFDCRFISIYCFYWFLCLILQIECYWDVGYIENMWYYSVLFSASIFSTTWVSMTVFPDDWTTDDPFDHEYYPHGCCFFAYGLKYHWGPFFTFSSFFFNFVWFFYDMIRLSIRSDNSSIMFYHINIILSTVAISFRGFYAYTYWIKFLNNTPIIPFYSNKIFDKQLSVIPPISQTILTEDEE